MIETARPLSRSESTLLLEVVAKRRPELLALAAAAAEGRLNLHERKKLIDVVAAELLATGFAGDDEPNRRGLALENLLDRINQPTRHVDV